MLLCYFRNGQNFCWSDFPPHLERKCNLGGNNCVCAVTFESIYNLHQSLCKVALSSGLLYYFLGWEGLLGKNIILVSVVKKISVWIQILFGKREKGKGEEGNDFQHCGLHEATTCASLDTNESKLYSWLSYWVFEKTWGKSWDCYECVLCYSRKWIKWSGCNEASWAHVKHIVIL